MYTDPLKLSDQPNTNNTGWVRTSYWVRMAYYDQTTNENINLSQGNQELKF